MIRAIPNLHNQPENVSVNPYPQYPHTLHNLGRANLDLARNLPLGGMWHRTRGYGIPQSPTPSGYAHSSGGEDVSLTLLAY